MAIKWDRGVEASCHGMVWLDSSIRREGLVSYILLYKVLDANLSSVVVEKMRGVFLWKYRLIGNDRVFIHFWICGRAEAM